MLFYFLVSRTIVTHMDDELGGIAARFSTILSVQGMPGIKRLAALEAGPPEKKRFFFRLLYPDGEVFASSYMPMGTDSHFKIDPGTTGEHNGGCV